MPIASSRTAPPASSATTCSAIPAAGIRSPRSAVPAGAVEHLLWRDHRGWGALHTAVCVGGTIALATAATSALRPSRTASVALTAAATWAVVGGTSLAREAGVVGRALEAGDIEAARARLPHLCGRDPQALDADGIARAVVESVAENTSDAVVGALVWGGIIGVQACSASAP